jgi:ABC-2 type transport system ATP-binding protein
MTSEEGAPPPLAVRNLTVRYARRTALAGVSLQVARGTVYALLGRNGAGKSSLVRCALGLQRPAEGSALLFGQDAWPSRAAALQRVGVVPESPDAPPEMTPERLGAFCARFHRRWDGDFYSARLRSFEVPAREPFARLSRGQKEAVMLALALASGPELLVLDDPTLGLDAVARQAFLTELVGELADRGTTVFITTHDLRGVEGIADQVGILHDGRLVVDEPLESLKARFRRVRLPRTVADPTGALAAFAPLGVRMAEGGTDAVVSAFDEARWPEVEVLTEAEASGLPLEDIFVAVTTAREGARP